MEPRLRDREVLGSFCTEGQGLYPFQHILGGKPNRAMKKTKLQPHYRQKAGITAQKNGGLIQRQAHNTPTSLLKRGRPVCPSRYRVFIFPHRSKINSDRQHMFFFVLFFKAFRPKCVTAVPLESIRGCTQLLLPITTQD